MSLGCWEGTRKAAETAGGGAEWGLDRAVGTGEPWAVLLSGQSLPVSLAEQPAWRLAHCGASQLLWAPRCAKRRTLLTEQHPCCPAVRMGLFTGSRETPHIQVLWAGAKKLFGLRLLGFPRGSWSGLAWHHGSAGSRRWVWAGAWRLSWPVRTQVLPQGVWGAGSSWGAAPRRPPACQACPSVAGTAAHVCPCAKEPPGVVPSGMRHAVGLGGDGLLVSGHAGCCS